MTVYVDDYQVSARVHSVRGCWSHLIADSRDELLGAVPVRWRELPELISHRFVYGMCLASSGEG